jgi:hypothetical protein
MKLFFIKFVFMIAIGITLTACGVKSMPQVPDGMIYPVEYPLPAPTEVIPSVLKKNVQSVPAVQDPDSFWQYPNTPPIKQLNGQ